MFKAVKHKKRLFMGLRKAQADLSLAKFILYYGPSYADSSIYDLDDYQSLLEDSHYDAKKNTVLYIHGYLEHADVESVHVIVEAYLQRDDTNLIILEWGELADGNYMFDAVKNCKQLARALAKHLLQLFEIKLDIEKFHVVGHSLGGQMAGMVGRHIYKKSGKTKKLKRISALDPAFPLFYDGVSAHINKKDAEFVDVIHTDAWLYGAPVKTGTADFWPNGGITLQPGCPKRNYKFLTDNDLSSHRRSWWFWAESVIDQFPDKFNAVKAKSWSDFKNGKNIDSKDQVVVMGHNCPTDIVGNYYLQTNGMSPFARGISGTTYSNLKETDATNKDESEAEELSSTGCGAKSLKTGELTTRESPDNSKQTAAESGK